MSQQKICKIILTSPILIVHSFLGGLMSAISRQFGRPLVYAAFHNRQLPYWMKLVQEHLRVNWKVSLTAGAGAVTCTYTLIALGSGTWLTVASFALATLALTVATFHLRHYARLADLESLNNKLAKTSTKFEKLTGEYKEENERLATSNTKLEKNVKTFAKSNRTLQRTNTRLDNQVDAMTEQVKELTQQTALLTLNMDTLRASATNIRDEVKKFTKKNKGFKSNLKVFDQQIENSEALHNKIATYLQTHVTQIGAHEQTLSEQLNTLSNYLDDLQNSDIADKIKALDALQQKAEETTERLHTTQVEYAAERRSLEEVRKALSALRVEFEKTLSLASDHNRDLGSNVSDLKRQIKKIDKLLKK